MYDNNGVVTDFTAETEITADTVVYALWDEVKLTVTFLLDKDGDEHAKIEEIKYNTALGEKMPANPSRGDDWKFLGWKYDVNGVETAFTKDTVITGDITVYATWEKRVKITFNPNGGTIGGKDKVEIYVDKGGSIGEELAKSNEPTRTGYRFKGWFVGGKEFTDFDKVLDADIELVAQWVQQVKVEFIWNYEGKLTEVYETQVIDINTKATKPDKDPTPIDADKYAFNGWFADANGVTGFNFDGAVSKDTKVYAKWTKLSQGFMEVTSGGKTASRRMLDNTENMKDDEATKYDLNYAFFDEHKVTLKKDDILKFKVEGSYVSFTLDSYSHGATLVTGTPTSLKISDDGEFSMYLKRYKTTNAWEIYIHDGKEDPKPDGVVKMASTGVYLTGTICGVASGWEYGLALTKASDNSQYEIENVMLKSGDTVKLRLGTNDSSGFTTLNSSQSQLVVENDSSGYPNYSIKADGDFSFYVKVNNINNPTSVTEFWIVYKATVKASDIPSNAGKMVATFYDGSVTIYLKSSSTTWVTAANMGNYNLYMWTEGGLADNNYFGSWPGAAMNANRTVKTSNAAVAGASLIINWNGGGTQTANLSGMVAGGTYVITIASKAGTVQRIVTGT